MIKNWLKEYQEEFQDYEHSVSNPFNVIDNDDRLEFLTTILTPNDQIESVSHNEILTLLTEMRSRLKEGKCLYQRFKHKVGSKLRDLSVPCLQLKSFFTNYLCNFLNRKEVHSSCHGAEKGWSTRKSLETHLPVRGALSFDLSSAFENTPFCYVFSFFFDSLNAPSYETRRDVAGFLARISTVRYIHGRALPQGATHSSSLFNRILYPLDSEISDQSKTRDMRYSRWIDDFTISSAGSEDPAAFLGAIELVMQHFPISPTKSFFQINNGNEENGVYLLGHIVHGTEIAKNSKEKKDMYKVKPLNLSQIIESKQYEFWS